MYFLSIKYDRRCWKTACLILSLFLKRGPEADWGEGGTIFCLNRLEPQSASESIFTCVASTQTNLLQQKEAQTREKKDCMLTCCCFAHFVVCFLEVLCLLKVFDYLTCLILRAVLTWTAFLNCFGFLRRDQADCASYAMVSYVIDPQYG